VASEPPPCNQPRLLWGPLQPTPTKAGPAGVRAVRPRSARISTRPPLVGGASGLADRREATNVALAHVSAEEVCVRSYPSLLTDRPPPSLPCPRVHGCNGRGVSVPLFPSVNAKLSRHYQPEHSNSDKRALGPPAAVHQGDSVTASQQPTWPPLPPTPPPAHRDRSANPKAKPPTRPPAAAYPPLPAPCHRQMGPGPICRCPSSR
jgi:hypothetical protein